MLNSVGLTKSGLWHVMPEKKQKSPNLERMPASDSIKLNFKGAAVEADYLMDVRKQLNEARNNLALTKQHQASREDVERAASSIATAVLVDSNTWKTRENITKVDFADGHVPYKNFAALFKLGEQYKLNVQMGTGANAKSMHFNLEKDPHKGIFKAQLIQNNTFLYSDKMLNEAYNHFTNFKRAGVFDIEKRKTTDLNFF